MLQSVAVSDTTAVSSAAAIESRRTPRSVAAFVIASGALTGAVNAFVNLLVAHQAGPDAFSRVSLLLQVIAIVGFLATGLQYSVARRVCAAHSGLRVREATRALRPWILACVVVAAASPLEASALRIGETGAVALTAAVMATTFVVAAPAGILVSQERVRLLYWTLAFGTVVRLAATLPLMMWFGAVVGPLAATLLGNGTAAAALVVAVLPRRTPTLLSRAAGDVRLGHAETLTNAVLAAALWLSWSLPLFLARSRVSSGAAGDIALAQTLAGGIIFVTAPVPSVFFARAARRGRATGLGDGLRIIGVVSAVCAVALTLMGPVVARIIYGREAGVAAALVFLAASVSAAAAAAWNLLLWIVRATGHRAKALLVSLLCGLVVECVVGIWTSSRGALLLLPLLGLGIAYVMALRQGGIRQAWQESQRSTDDELT
jgi:hypothetical protein